MRGSKQIKGASAVHWVTAAGVDGEVSCGFAVSRRKQWTLHKSEVTCYECLENIIAIRKAEGLHAGPLDVSREE